MASLPHASANQYYQETWTHDPWQDWTTSSATTQTIWLTWTATATNNVTQDAWVDWSSDGTSASVYVTPGNGRAHHRPTAAEIERSNEKARERSEKARLARDRARAILLENLDDDQRSEFEKSGFFHVETKDGQRRYRLRPGSLPIRVSGEDGRRWSYCIHPHSSDWPACDVALTLKLMLEADEEEFLRIANASYIY